MQIKEIYLYRVKRERSREREVEREKEREKERERFLLNTIKSLYTSTCLIGLI